MTRPEETTPIAKAAQSMGDVIGNAQPCNPAARRQNETVSLLQGCFPQTHHPCSCRNLRTLEPRLRWLAAKILVLGWQDKK